MISSIPPLENENVLLFLSRRLCSGKTPAFQAGDAGSIPARRSNIPVSRSVDRRASDCFQTINVLEREFVLHGVGKVSGILLQKK